MRTSKLTDEQLIEKIASVFRRHGFAGASLSMLSEATGLERASLYHRYPGGKEQMAEAVLEHVGQVLERELFAPLRKPGTPASKLKAAQKTIRVFYQDGHLPCVLETFSLGGATPRLRRALAAATGTLIAALAALARELRPIGPAAAKERAAAALVLIEGGLILTRVTEESVHFDRAIDHLGAVLNAA